MCASARLGASKLTTAHKFVRLFSLKPFSVFTSNLTGTFFSSEVFTPQQPTQCESKQSSQVQCKTGEISYRLVRTVITHTIRRIKMSHNRLTTLLLLGPVHFHWNVCTLCISPIEATPFAANLSPNLCHLKGVSYWGVQPLTTKSSIVLVVAVALRLLAGSTTIKSSGDDDDDAGWRDWMASKWIAH